MAYEPMAGGNYDYANAWKGGAMQPRGPLMPPGKPGHLDSVDPTSGMLLKRPSHPTMWKEDAMSGNTRLPWGDNQFSTPSQFGQSIGQGGQFKEMMQDPRFAQLVQSTMQKKKQMDFASMLQKRESREASLAKSLPKLQHMQEKFKLEDMQRKVKKMQLDMLTK